MALKNIFTKLNKDPERVELSKYDFVAFKNQFDKAFSEYRSEYRIGINKAKSSADAYSVSLYNILQDAEKLMDEFGSKAEEIGVDFRSSKQYQQFQEIKKILLSAISNVKEKQKEISKIL